MISTKDAHSIITNPSNLNITKMTNFEVGSKWERLHEKNKSLILVEMVDLEVKDGSRCAICINQDKERVAILDNYLLSKYRPV